MGTVAVGAACPRMVLTASRYAAPEGLAVASPFMIPNQSSGLDGSLSAVIQVCGIRRSILQSLRGRSCASVESAAARKLSVVFQVVQPTSVIEIGTSPAPT